MNQWGEISSTGICTVQIEGIYNLNIYKNWLYLRTN
jgi:hypothetical protein